MLFVQKKLIMVGSCKTLSTIPLLKLLIEKVEEQSGILNVSQKDIKIQEPIVEQNNKFWRYSWFINFGYFSHYKTKWKLVFFFVFLFFKYDWNMYIILKVFCNYL